MIGTNLVAVDQAIGPLVLAVDIGTSSARALLYDARGRSVLGHESHVPYLVATSDDGGAVLDPGVVESAMFTCLDNVMAALRRSHLSVDAVACDTFWHSLLGLDRNHQPVTPIFTWADTRAWVTVTELRRRFEEDAVHGRTGAVFHPSYWPAKLLWLAQSYPGFRDVARWVSPGEYLYTLLFGVERCSISMASGTGIFDQHRCDWDAELLDALPIERRQLSDIAEFAESAHGLVVPYAGRWPLLATIPWLFPLGDGACNNVGSGGISEEWLVVMIGTSGALRMVRAVDKVEIPAGIWTYRVDRRRVVQGGAFSDGGNALAWLAKTLSFELGAELQTRLSGLQPQDHGLSVLPFLAGERSPNWNPRATAAMVGMDLHTSQIDVVLAWMEAIAYRFADVFERLPNSLEPMKGIIGSGAGLLLSPAWMQIMSDVLCQPIYASAVPEASSRGAALLALEAMNQLSCLADAPAPLGQIVRPREKFREYHIEARNRQHDLYDRLLSGRRML